MRQVFLVAVILIGVSQFAFAWDPRILSFEETMASSQCVFSGIVQSAEITASDDPEEVTAQAKVKISYCLYGEKCEPNQTITINYYAQTIKDTYLSVDFPVGENVLIALKSKCSVEHNFQSKAIDKSYDSVFVCNVFPYSMKDIAYKFSCTDTMFNKKSNLMSYQDVRNLTQSQNINTATSPTK